MPFGTIPVVPGRLAHVKLLTKDKCVYVFSSWRNVLTSIAFCLAGSKPCIVWLSYRRSLSRLVAWSIPGDVCCCSVWSGIFSACLGSTCWRPQWQLTWKTSIAKFQWEGGRREESCCVGRVEGCRPLISFSCLTFVSIPKLPFDLVNFLQIVWLRLSNFRTLPKVYGLVNWTLREHHFFFSVHTPKLLNSPNITYDIAL